MTLLAMRYGAGSPQGSISLAADDATVTVAAGSTVDISLIVTRTNWTGTVSLAVSGLPSGVTGSFSDSSLTGGETTSVLTLTADPAAGVVTNYAFTITASGFGVTDATVAGTCTVTASGARGVPASGQIYGEDLSVYADTAAFLANTAPENNFGTGQLYQYPKNRTLFEISSDFLFNGGKALKLPCDNTQGPPAMSKYFSSSYANAAQYWVAAYSAGFTASGSDTNQSAGYKQAFMGWDIANGRVGTEWANDLIFCGGGWTSATNDSYGGGDGTTTAPNAPYNENTGTYGGTEGVSQSPPYALKSAGGIWHTPQWVCFYQEAQHINSTQIRVRHWTWLYGTEPSVSPYASFIYTLRIGSLPRINKVTIMDGTFNQPIGSRYALPGQAMYLASWRVYDLDTTPNPLNLY